MTIVVIEIFYGKGLQFVFMLHNLQIHEFKTVFVFITYVEYGTFGAIRIMYQHYRKLFLYHDIALLNEFKILWEYNAAQVTFLFI